MSVEFSENKPEPSLSPERRGRIRDILAEGDTGVLKRMILQRTLQFTSDEQGIIARIIPLIEESYRGKRRGLTGQSTINHAYRVALLVAENISPDQLPATFATALTHDLIEDTDMTREKLERQTNKDIATGVDVLSHADNERIRDGYREYDSAGNLRIDRQKYLDHIGRKNLQNPELNLAIIKACDLLANANDPLLVDSVLQGHEESWEKMRQKKLAEMEILRQAMAGDPDVIWLIDAFSNFTKEEQQATKPPPTDIPQM
jgi:(p)ppGpp synthase/HD superfamily hydrolase